MSSTDTSTSNTQNRNSDSISIDEPDIQLAAEALESLRTSGSTATSPAASPPPTTSFLSRVSNSAVKVYNSSKSYSPRFRYSAEKLESVAGSLRNRASNGFNNGNNKVVSTPSPTPRHQYHHHHGHHQRKNSGAVTPGAVKKKRPAWQHVLVTATSLASLSVESRQRLRYFLHMLKLANTKLATTVNKLQELIQQEEANAMAQSIASNHVPPSSGPIGDSESNISDMAARKSKINYLKQDVINTIKKVVTVISTFAGNSLPEPARSHVRALVLRLPSNWANSVTTSPQTITPKEESSDHSNNDQGEIEKDVTPTSMGVASKNNKGHARSPHSVASDETVFEQPAAGDSGETRDDNDQTEIEAGGRVLSLAKETLEMVGSIIGVVDETLEKAEAWCGRAANNKDKQEEDEQFGEDVEMLQQMDQDDGNQEETKKSQ